MKKVLIFLFVVSAVVIGATEVEARRIVNRLKCSSIDHQYNECRIGQDVAEVRVVNRLSSSSCIEGYSFGVRRRKLWVDNGCRAIFEVIKGHRRSYDNDYDYDYDNNYDNDRRFDDDNSDLDNVLDAIDTFGDIIDIFSSSKKKRCEIGLYGRRGRLIDTFSAKARDKKEACRKARQKCRDHKNRRQTCSRI